MENQTAQRMQLLQELISCNADIYTWCFDSNCELLESNCPQASIFATFLSTMGYKDYLLDYAKAHTMTLEMGTAIGLSWMAAFEKTGDELKHIYMIGPVFTTEVSFDVISELLNTPMGNTPSLEWKNRLLRAMEPLPVISATVWNEYAVMLHYCVTGEKISRTSIARKHEKVTLVAKKAPRKDRHKTWVAEQYLMRMIREGDLNYKEALNRSGLVSSGVPVHAKDPLRQAKDSVITSIALCTRAAIEGGLSPEQAYSMGDAYLQSVEDAPTTTDVGVIHDTMFGDFVQQVHKCRTNMDVSRQIRMCCDYIETHTEDKLKISELAAYVGYTEYYLSRKFKSEMNVSLNDYIKIAKVERSKYLLSTTDLDIQQISDALHFCSRSHFGDVFRKIVGCSPVEYRAKL